MPDFSSPAKQGDSLLDGASLIAAERQRQIDAEGWTSSHDDEHDQHELAYAAACYAAPDQIFVGRISTVRVEVEPAWPWEAEEFKPDLEARAWVAPTLPSRGMDSATVAWLHRPELRAARVRELSKAGALIAAEIDRLQRLGDG